MGKLVPLEPLKRVQPEGTLVLSTPGACEVFLALEDGGQVALEVPWRAALALAAAIVNAAVLRFDQKGEWHGEAPGIRVENP